MGKANMVRARVAIRGIRPLLQHQFGPDAIPLEKQERHGVAGNDPSEWRRSMMVTGEGQLFIRNTYVFGCLRDAAKHTKKGKGSIQPVLAATLQIEEAIILLDRWLPKDGDPSTDPTAPVYIDICGVRNPSSKARNVRYRLATSPGWRCSFTLLWDKTLVSRDQMQSVLNDASVLCGLGDGRSVGNGRFEVVSWEELKNAKEAPAEGSLASAEEDRLAEGQEEMCSLPTVGASDEVPHGPQGKRKKRDQSTV